MSGDKHSPGIQKGKFCALRTEPDAKCKCDACSCNYRVNCKTSWTETEFFLQGKTKVKKYYEAHHLLCVASVTAFVAKKEEIETVVMQTQWCINHSDNMFAMPVWGHTIKHYCDVAARGLGTLERFYSRKGAPPFEKIPQHDYDHNSAQGYTYEVDQEMTEIAQSIAESKAKHEAKVKSLRSKLDRASKFYLGELKRRGKRCNGTHKAWDAGKKGEDPEWYKPFSMADDVICEPRAFPGTPGDGKLFDKIQALVNAAGGGR